MGLFSKKPPKTHLTDDGIFVIFRDFTLLEDKDFNELWRLLGVMVKGRYIQEQEGEQSQEQTTDPPSEPKKQVSVVKRARPGGGT